MVFLTVPSYWKEEEALARIIHVCRYPWTRRKRQPTEDKAVTLAVLKLWQTDVTGAGRHYYDSGFG